MTAGKDPIRCKLEVQGSDGNYGTSTTKLRGEVQQPAFINYVTLPKAVTRLELHALRKKYK